MRAARGPTPKSSRSCRSRSPLQVSPITPSLSVLSRCSGRCSRRPTHLTNSSAEVFAAAHSANVVALDGLGERMGAAGPVLREVVRLRGGAEAIARGQELLAPLGCAGTLDGLAETWRLLETTSVAERCLVDFSIMRDFDYYTGLVFEAYAPGLGMPFGGGGRYDDALGRLGAPRPAAGFAIGLERLLIALAETGVAIEPPAAVAVVRGDAASAFVEAAARRQRGERVVVDPQEAS